MSSKKRSAGHLDEIPESGQPLKRGPAGKRALSEGDEMGDFEDEWEDDVDRDDDAIDGAKSDNEDGVIALLSILEYSLSFSIAMEIDVQPAIEDSDPAPGPTQTFIPGRHVLSKDEILEPAQSAYEMLHRMHVAWPCLSFDILRDNLGDERRKYPATAFSVTGTQADQAKNNEVLVLKMSSLHKTQKDDGQSIRWGFFI
jgi:ribosome assembly protein RRB1